MLTARLSASIHATMHAAILDACVRARLKIVVTQRKAHGTTLKRKIFCL